MSKKEVSETKMSLPQVKQVLDAIGDENLDQFQRRTLDYVSKFTKSATDARAMCIGGFAGTFTAP